MCCKQWRTEQKCRPGRWPQMPPFEDKNFYLRCQNFWWLFLVGLIFTYIVTSFRKWKCRPLWKCRPGRLTPSAPTLGTPLVVKADFCQFGKFCILDELSNVDGVVNISGVFRNWTRGWTYFPVSVHVPPISGNFSFPRLCQNFPPDFVKFTCFYILYVYFVSPILLPWCIYASHNARTGRPQSDRRRR